MRTSLFVLSFLLLSFSPTLAQDLQLFESFTNNAVLQRNVDHPVWGWTKPGRTVKVLFGEQKLSVKADNQGRWRVSLPPMGAGGPHRLSVLSGRESILLTDIYFGDVYLLSGQSNMEWKLTQSDPDGSRAKAIADPMIRELKVKRTYDSTPRQHLDVNGGWITGNAEGISQFSGVGSYFAHYVRKEVDVPIGLLHSSWGGSRIEPWMSPEALGMDANAALAKNKEMVKEAGLPARKRFAVDFPGRDIPTSDDGEDSGWLTPGYNDNGWPTREMPGHWEGKGYRNVDGVFYFRKKFTLTAAQAAGKATLHLGPIDDGDWTHVNGKFVGSNPSAYSKDRVYEVEPGVLKAGENLLAVRVVDTGGEGGFTGPADKMKLVTAGGTVALDGDYKFNIGKFTVAAGSYNQVPVVLYNAMIAPLEGYPLTGVLWYQGESNAGEGDAEKYANLMRGLVNQWRGFFKNAKLPFYWVQLANFREAVSSADEPGWAVLRQSQTAATDLPMTGQAIITDIGEADDIHPKNKWEVGRRLSLHALKDIYGKKVVADSPSLKKVHKIEGMTVLEFENIGGGLMTKSKDRYGYAKGFTVKDKAGKWHFAQALLDPADNMVAIVNPAGTGITMVRYNWANNPDGNLFSKEGLPVDGFEASVE
ncbi:sialate O-acetylesterase [Neolewinella persica]|uniref:sialate O-acetylesterase n=1 Tax=Neolewinella persica TaxID=70998 RepID=UPI0003614222|nr:sialate O-acetylesterase [Neolewinella persica]